MEVTLANQMSGFRFGILFGSAQYWLLPLQAQRTHCPQRSENALVCWRHTGQPPPSELPGQAGHPEICTRSSTILSRPDSNRQLQL